MLNASSTAIVEGYLQPTVSTFCPVYSLTSRLMAPVAFVICAQSRPAMACPSKEWLTRHESKWYRRKPTLQSFHYDLLVSSNRASYRRLLAQEHINVIPAYFFISCQINHLSEHLTCMDNSKSSRRLSCKSQRYAIYTLLSGDHRGWPPSRFFNCWSNLLPAERKQWKNQNFGRNYKFGFALLCSAIGKQNLPWEPTKISITTSTFNCMELSIILIARLPDCLFTCMISYL